MSATFVARIPAVTPATIRRRAQGRLRGPVARPLQPAMPVGRPVQPSGPELLAGPVQLELVGSAERGAAGAVQLTDRGIFCVVAVLAVLAVATVAVGLSSFLSVSNAPLEPSARPSPVLVELSR